METILLWGSRGQTYLLGVTLESSNLLQGRPRVYPDRIAVDIGPGGLYTSPTIPPHWTSFPCTPQKTESSFWSSVNPDYTDQEGCSEFQRKDEILKGFSSLSRLIPGRFAGLGEGHRPIDERLHRRTERFPKLGEFIFHLWWKLRMNGSLHQLALLKETQLLRQHTL